MPTLTQSTNYFFKQSEVVINDSLFDMLNSHEKSYEMFEEKVRDNYINFSTRGDGKIKERQYIQIYLRSTNEQTIYTLEVYDILTYLSDLGGLYDIVFAVGSLLAMSFTAKIFNAALITQAYRV